MMDSLQRLTWLFLSSGIAFPAAAEVQPSETWVPTSHAAQAIGSVTLAPGQITFQDGASLQLSQATSMLFRPEPKSKKVMADLYRVTQSTNPSRENANKFCGTRPVVYLIVWRSEKPGEADLRTIVAFSGPKFDPGSHDECGRFVYKAGLH